MRPVVYDDDEGQQEASPQAPHPYSLREFTNAEPAGDEMQLRLHRQQLDSFHHNFWTDVSSVFCSYLHLMYFDQSNSRFEATKQDVLSNLSDSATELEKEDALSDFYKQWLEQEKTRMDNYTNEWRSRNREEIMLSARVQYRKLASRLSRTFTLPT
jgi:hypothetical protein